MIELSNIKSPVLYIAEPIHSFRATEPEIIEFSIMISPAFAIAAP